MHTILGAGGVIGNNLAAILLEKGEQVRLVGRNPKAIGTAELFKADLMSAESVRAAVAGSKVVYLVVGLPYNIKVWETQWDAAMTNAIAACEAENCRLIFFDNVYMYGRVTGKMTEETPNNPCSRKGVVRERIANAFMDAIKRGTLKGSIARAADFYGPGTDKSVIGATVFDNFAKGKSAQWLISDKYVHTFTEVYDASYGTYLLGQNADTDGQIWHLPTTKELITGKEFITKAAAVFEVKPRYSLLSKFMLRVLGLFIPILKEVVEMTYQNDQEYIFDSTKFERRFNYTAMSYDEGLKRVRDGYRA